VHQPPVASQLLLVAKLGQNLFIMLLHSRLPPLKAAFQFSHCRYRDAMVQFPRVFVRPDSTNETSGRKKKKSERLKKCSMTIYRRQGRGTLRGGTFHSSWRHGDCWASWLWLSPVPSTCPMLIASAPVQGGDKTQISQFSPRRSYTDVGQKLN
jgi:hypothetical protein